MSTKVIIIFGVLMLVVEISVIGFLVHLKNQAPTPEEQKKFVDEDVCGQLADSGGSDLLGLSAARGKAMDARIKATLAQVRVQAELYWDEHGGYGSSTSVAQRSLEACLIRNSIFDKNDKDSVYKLVEDAETVCDPSSRWVAACALGRDGETINYAVSVLLPIGGSWCVDSSGVARMGKAQGGGDAPAECSGAGFPKSIKPMPLPPDVIEPKEPIDMDAELE